MAKSTSFKQQCPICDAMVPIKDQTLIGKKLSCPLCKGAFVVKAPTANGKAAQEEKDELDTPPPSRKGAETVKLKTPARKKPPVEEELEELEELEEVEEKPRARGKPAPVKPPVKKKPAPQDEEIEELEDLEEVEEKPRPKASKAAVKAPGKPKTPARKKPALEEEEPEDLNDEDLAELRKKVEDGEEEEEEAEAESKKKGKKKGKKGKKSKQSLVDLIKQKKVLVGAGLAVVGVLLLVVFVILNSSGGTPARKNNTPVTPGPLVEGPGGENEDQGKKPATPVNTAPVSPPKPQEETGLEPAGPAFTNLLPNDTEYVLHLDFKQILDSPLGEAAFRTPGAFREEDLKARLGFSVRGIDAILRAESYSSKWAFNIFHTTTALSETKLKETLGLVDPAGGPIKGLKYYQLSKTNPWLEQFARLSLSPHSTRDAAQLQARPLFVYLVDKQTLIVADHGPLQDFLLNGGKFGNHPEAIAGSTPAGNSGQPGNMPPMGVQPMPMPGKDGVQPMPMPGTQPLPGMPPTGQPNKGLPGTPPTGQPPAGTPGVEPSPMTPGSTTATWMTISPRLKGMLQRMEPRGSKGGKALFRSALEVPVARGTKKTNTSALGALRHIWDVTQLLRDRQLPITVLGTALHKKDPRVYLFQNGMDCSSEPLAKVFKAELVMEVGPKIVTFFNEVLGHTVTLEKTPSPTGGDPNNPMPIPGQPMPMPMPMPIPGMDPNNPNQPMQNPDDPSEDARASRLRVIVQEKYVRVALDLVFLARNDWDRMYGTTALIMCGLRSELDAFAGLSPRQRLAQAVKTLGEQGASEQNIPPGHFPPGAFPREGAATGPDGAPPSRLAREPLHRVSWMAGLLPYLGHQVVHSQIKFDKSWKEPANWMAARTIIPEFLDPNYPSHLQRVNYPGLPLELGATHYIGLAGVGIDSAEFDREDPAQAGKLGVFGYQNSATLEQIKKGRGLQNVAVLVQVRPNGPEGLTPWIAGGGSTVRGVPEKNSFAPFVSKHGGQEGSFVLMADGSVRFVKKGVSDEVFQAMATVNGPTPKGFDINSAASLVEPEKAPAQGKTEPGKKGAGVTQPPKATAPGDDWKLHQAADGSYKVMFPGTPQEVKLPLPPQTGTGTIAMVETNGKKDGFMVLTLALTPEAAKTKSAEALLQEGLQMLTSKFEGAQVKSEKAIKLGALDGKEMVLEAPGKGTANIRAFAAANRAFIVMAGVANPTAQAASVQRFLDSFSLTK